MVDRPFVCSRVLQESTATDMASELYTVAMLEQWSTTSGVLVRVVHNGVILSTTWRIHRVCCEWFNG